ncbi:MAG: L-arginine-binding protein [uncultured Thiotrichaceae bacterium]|uniref:L-arginine-binding protein n=1 Tax=uncultured Thiotrichaceae bacterium TaxID=298394 RepID=A0A6S6UIZ5_9GAMM|nr:MAG: L-arginine-binding protein [uncultured Thiotrichaceae bacterium]
MKHHALLFVALLTCSLLMNVQADEKAQKKLYFGIENNRIPYSNLDDKQQPYGALIDATRHICKNIKAECEFVPGDFDQLMQDVQTYKLQGLIVIDTFLLPETDRLKLTPALCKIQPVFIQKRQGKHRSQKEDFKNTTIGVLEGSLLHFYLLDEYSNHSRIKSYPLLESGVFDLFSGRITALFTDQAFFTERVKKTLFGNEEKEFSMIAMKTTKITLPDTSMRLALREQDNELYEELTKVIQAQGKTPACIDLLTSSKPSTPVISITEPPLLENPPRPMTPTTNVNDLKKVQPKTEQLAPKTAPKE